MYTFPEMRKEIDKATLVLSGNSDERFIIDTALPPGMVDLRICPKCGSLEIRGATLIGSGVSTLDAAGQASTGIGNAANFNAYHCEECSYTGICPIVEEEEVARFRRQLRQA